MKNKKYAIFVAVVAVLSFVLITAGVTYAFFSYIGTGLTENTIEAGSITFHYDETTKNGRGISLVDALPVTLAEEDATFLADTTEGNVFNFNISSETGSTIEMPYDITARVKDGSTLDQSLVRIYLTKVDGNSETAVVSPTYFNTLDPYNNSNVERILWHDIVPLNSKGANSYSQDYRLRMWLGANADYSQAYKCQVTQNDVTTDATTYTTEDACLAANTGVAGDPVYAWNSYYPLNDKTFTITVNVYSTGNVNTTGTTSALYSASQISYSPSSVYPTTVCTGNDATIECALDELNTLLGA